MEIGDMNTSKFYVELEELLELSGGTLHGGQALDKLPEWDSLAVISFIALADSTYGVMLQPKKINECKTVDDLARLIEGNETTK